MSTLTAETTVNKTPSTGEKEHHGGAGDNIGRNYHDQPSTSRQCTARRRRNLRHPKRTSNYNTPQAVPKRQLGGSEMRGYPSSFMPMAYSQNTSDDLFAFNDIDVLLYSFKELYDLVEPERFARDPAIVPPFHDSSPGSNKMVRPRVNSRPNRKDVNDFDISTLKLDEPAPEVVSELPNGYGVTIVGTRLPTGEVTTRIKYDRHLMLALSHSPFSLAQPENYPQIVHDMDEIIPVYPRRYIPREFLPEEASPSSSDTKSE